ncbi:HD domain-containing protein [Nonomuraea sp. NPDC050310]|uniref:HD domain-containing protein n=1 Tax=Nonomuraea sp. NPDC050310 TaxID=3154935 RepID=UPI0033C2946F
MNFPDSPACRAALEVATAFHTPSLLNHSVRAYLWAEWYAAEHGIGYDAELLFVSAMLHDIGLAQAFDNHELTFEEAGANVAWVFGAGAGWPVERRVRAGEVIIRHMWDKVDVAEDPEGFLLELSTAMDISGRQTDELPGPLRARVLAAYPRFDLATEFAGCFAAQAERKPDSLAAVFVRGGLAGKLARNPLEQG